MSLFAAGCSMTYGHGLEDCYDIVKQQPGKEPSKLAWPSMLAKQMKTEVINLSKPGGSNDHAISQLIKSNISRHDTVVVLWSFLTRAVFFTKENTEHYGEWDETYLKNLLYYSNAFDIQIKSLLKIHNFTKYLESLEVGIYYMFMDKFDCLDSSSNHYSLIKKLWTGIEKYDLTKSTFDVVQRDFALGEAGEKALDGIHPGPLWHEKLSKYIHRSINAPLI